jgi:hypothetical protein
MKLWLPLLALLAGLGSSITFAQDKQQIDPFDRYLAGIKSNQPEATLVRFAGECGVDINARAPRYADRPDNSWMQVKDLSKGIHGLATDFFATVAVWKQSDRILVELWVMELDVASESRTFYCLDKRIIALMESADWSLPITEQGGKENPGWGYEQLWKMTGAGKYERTLHGFVDSAEKPIIPPKLNVETQKRLNWTPTVRNWNDLKLPPALLR